MISKSSYFIALVAFSLASIQSLAEIPSQVFSELKQFRFESNPLPDDYVQEFPRQIENRVKKEESIFQAALKNKCQQQVSVQFLENFTASKEAAIVEFEAGLVRIEASYCFQQTSPKKVLALLADPQFLLSAFPTIIPNGVEVRDQAICEKTNAFSIGKSNYCYTMHLPESDSDYLKITSFNIWNDTDTATYSAPVYFRENFMSARQSGDQTLFHLINYFRGPKLSKPKQFFANGVIRKTQEEVFAMMASKLNAVPASQ